MFLILSMSQDSILMAFQCAHARCETNVERTVSLSEAVAGSGLAGKLGGGKAGVGLLKQAVTLMGVDPKEGVALDVDLNLYCDECADELEAIK